jgi:hypothetical protein
MAKGEKAMYDGCCRDKALTSADHRVVRFKNQPFFKLKAQLHMAYDIPTTFTRFHKV